MQSKTTKQNSAFVTHGDRSLQHETENIFTKEKKKCTKERKEKGKTIYNIYIGARGRAFVYCELKRFKPES